MYFIFYWVCISYFYFVGVHNTPKNGVHGVRRNYIPKRCVIHTIVLTVYIPIYNAASDWPRTFFTPRVFSFSIVFPQAICLTQLLCKGGAHIMHRAFPLYLP